jgi:hypothetical protein
MTGKNLIQVGRTVSSFFDYIENIIENHVTMTMQNMAESIDRFLTFNEYKVLEGKGRVSKAQADKKALEGYKHFNKIQRIDSDFNRQIAQTLEGLKPVEVKKK